MVSTEVILERECMTIGLRIEVQVDDIDPEFGTPLKTFKPVCDSRYREATVTGRVEILAGRELENARRLFPTATHRVTIPFIRLLTMRHRFVVMKNERVLEIGHLNDVEMQGIKHICTCAEVVAVGQR